jgi:hypothetical protein
MLTVYLISTGGTIELVASFDKPVNLAKMIA